jgi:curved DNA-binding protein CbpA
LRYFRNIKTVQGLRKRYKKLSLQLHPDINALNISDEERAIRTEKFQEMENEYRKSYQNITNPVPEPPKTEKTQKRPNSAKNAEKTSPVNAPQSTETDQGIPKHGLKDRLKDGFKSFAKSGVGTIVLDEAENAVNNIVSRTIKELRKKITE